MSMQEKIETKIRTSLAPSHLQVINESHRHSVPPGSESHFKLVIVSERFEGLRLVQRHQTVNRILDQELRDGIHALSLQTLTAAEWTRREGRTLASPPCLGGSKAEG